MKDTLPSSEHNPQLLGQAGFMIDSYLPSHPPSLSIMEQTVSGFALHLPPGQLSPQNGPQSKRNHPNLEKKTGARSERKKPRKKKRTLAPIKKVPF